MKLLLRYKFTSLFFLVMSGAYLAATVLPKPDKASLVKYNISASELKMLVLTIALPYVVIWLFALLGYLRFKTYADTIKDSRDGVAFTQISRGLLLLSIWLPISAVAGSLSTIYYHAHPSATPTMVILVNYLNLALLFPGFFILNKGSRKLLSLTKATVNAVSQRTSLLFICFSAFYVMITIKDSARFAPTHSTTIASYYLPDWLIITTIVIPMLIMWFLGVQAIEDIYLYRKKVKGKIYKVALNKFARGIAGIVLATILLRCVQSLSSPIGSLSLALIFLLIYVLLAALAFGYALVARGAKSLQKIEDM